MIKLLFLADVVGNVGRRSVKGLLPKLKERFNPTISVVNGENASGGVGTDPATAEEIFAAGADVITGGNHTWNRKELWPYLDKHRSRILRPHNFPADAPGTGVTFFKSSDGVEIAVVNLIGRIFMNDNVECPFRAADKILTELPSSVKAIFVDFHGEATSEKVALGYHLDGKVSCVVGTHTHVQTADERILPNGTAYISDVGMCGPYDSVIGMRCDQVVQRFHSGLPVKFETAKGQGMVNGVYLEIDETTGKAVKIERIREFE